jgi:hypothetical protein
MAFDGGSSMGDANPANAGTNIDAEVATVLDLVMYEDRFNTMVDITEDPYDADPTGEVPIGDALIVAWEDSSPGAASTRIAVAALRRQWTTAVESLVARTVALMPSVRFEFIG